MNPGRSLRHGSSEMGMHRLGRDLGCLLRVLAYGVVVLLMAVVVLSCLLLR